MQRLVLFDIDGTLLDAGGTAARAFRAALEEVFGTSGKRNGYSFAGKTDPQIARDLLGAAGIEAERIEAGLGRAWELYLERLRVECVPARVRLHAGVEPLVRRLDRAPEAALGLLTGNLRGGAETKLRAAGLEFERFVVGAYGSDHGDRRELPSIAIDRAERRLGRRFAGKEVVVIGDTPHDIACGEHLGVRTIAVATGTYSAAELAACEPDHLFDDLADEQLVWEAIFAD
jgi:phosphoglycolate phosphatase